MTTLTPQENKEFEEILDNIFSDISVDTLDKRVVLKDFITTIKHTATIQGARKYKNIINKGKCNNEDVLFLKEVNKL